ncbi:MAG: deoxyhypusine synthase family protein [Candidatus Thermoplasmatota archaeon]|nr:deoxyhypusine synthase family protein [Candidatus Thermoplasmatota archaeon]
MPTREELLSKTIKQVKISQDMKIADLVDAMGGMSIQARNLGNAAKIYEKMLTDPQRPTIILGLSGPLIAAGLRNVLRDMVALGLVDVIVSTGAVMYQDFYQARGYQHYKGHPDMDNVMLRDHMIDRIYDTLVDEEKFGETDMYVGELAEKLERRPHSSREFLAYLGEVVPDENGILHTAYKLGVPIFSPALNDSSIGIGLTWTYRKQLGGEHMTIDPIRDNYEITQILVESKKTAVIYIGGGTPKNYVNDAVVMANYAMDRDEEGHEYAIQLTTATTMDGGLSGSTLAEAQSWGKVYKDAKKQMVNVEASIGLPLLAGYVIQKNLHEGRKRLRFNWEKDRLLGIEEE